MKEQFSFTGRVIEGHHLGHTLGFPTANIVVTPGERVPAFGVYAAWVTLPDGTRHAAVTNLGVRPTVEEAEAAEAGLDIEAMVQAAVEGIERIRL